MNKKKKNSKIMLGMLIAVIALGIGYASIIGVDFLINGTSSVKANGNFIVRFVKPLSSEIAIENAEANAIKISGKNADSTDMDVSGITASIEDDTHATFAAGELDEVGEYVEFTYTVINESDGIDANLAFDVTDSNDYFEITKTVSKEKISEGETATVKVKVELISQPKVDDVETNFSITLNATPTEEVSGESSGSGESIANKLIDNVSLGDYVSLTPSYSGSYNCETLGCSGSITPSELNMWRVISIDDATGTVDIVSENISSTKITFSGEFGYKYYVTALQTLATKYENETYTSGSRMMGYNGQTGTISGSLSTTTAGKTTTPTLTDEVGEEYREGYAGDTLYAKDFNSVTNALGTSGASDSSGTAQRYWIASRWYYYSSDTYYIWGAEVMWPSGSVGADHLRRYSYGMYNLSPSYPIRPILTLKSDLIVTNGDGKSAETAWELSEN